MLKKLASDGAIYGISGAFSKGAQLILLPIYTRVFSPAEYGVIDLIIVFAALVNLTVALEISQAVARYYGTSGLDEERKRYASSALIFSIGAYLLFFIVAFAASGWLSEWWLGSVQWWWVLQVAAGAIALNGIYIFLLDLLRWQLKPKFFALVSMLYTIVTVLVSLYFVLILERGIAGVFYGQLVGAILGITIILTYSRSTYAFHFYWAECKVMLSYSFPLVFFSIAVFVNLNVDRLAINELMGVSDVGVYGVGFRISSVMTLLLMGVQAALIPLIFQNYKKDSTPVELARIIRYLFILVFGAILMLGLFSRDIVGLVAAPAYYQAAIVVPVLAFTFFFSNPYNFSPGILLAKKTKLMAAIGVCSACLNVLLNIIFIPQYGILGAAVATLVASLAGLSLTVYYSQIYYPIPYDWKRIGGAILTLFLALICVKVFFSTGQWEELWPYKFLFMLVFSVLITFTLLKKDEFLNLIYRLHLGKR